MRLMLVQTLLIMCFSTSQ